MKNENNFPLTTGQRIKFFRERLGITQKALGEMVGFKKNPDVRIAQYESDSRKPKAELLERFADALSVHPLAFTLSLEKYDNNENQQVLMWIFLALEDQGILVPKVIDDKIALVLDTEKFPYENFLKEWAYNKNLVEKGLVAEDVYTDWKYS